MTSVALAQSVAGASTGLDGWWYRGYLEAGWRGWLNNPQRDGVTSSGGKSLAKYYEYSTIKPGPFLDGQVIAGTKDGRYLLDAWAKNVGYSDQRYLFDASKAGEWYLGFIYDQTPHVYSTSAQTLYNGVGTNALTLPAGLSSKMFGDAGCTFPPVAGCVSPITAANAAKVRNDILANQHLTDIGIRRDTAAVETRYTPNDNWDIRANYSNLSRTGTQIDGVVFSPGTSGTRVDAPRPVSDTTQNVGASGEYAGTSFWNQKFNFKVAYNGSFYKDDSASYTVENPFCSSVGAGAGTGDSCARNGSLSSPLALMSLPPDNQANAVTGTLGAELPWKSRYMGTVSYNAMRQNQAFNPFTLTSAFANNGGANVPAGWVGIPGVAANSIAALPANSLNGAIDTLLINNVVTTQITPDLKWKMNYRYYDFNNNTPQFTFADWVLTDAVSAKATTAAYAPVRNINISYTKQNAGGELTWRPNRQWNIGGGYGYERYTYSGADATATNENSGKLYADWKPADWITARASVAVSQRRAENYDYLAQVAAIQWPVAGGSRYSTQYRQFALDDRDRQRGQISLALDIVPGVTLTPTAGFKNDNYGFDPLTQEGLNYSRSNYYGLELNQVINHDTVVLLSGMTEYRSQLISSAGTSAPPFPAASLYHADVKDRVTTFMAAVNHTLIPDKLDLRASYTIALSSNDQPLIFNNGAGPTAASGGQYPSVTSTWQRVDAQAIYRFDEETVRRMGWLGTVAIKARYAYERNIVQNWQIDPMQTYMYTSTLTGVGYMTWLAWNNPNYDVHLISGSIIFAW
jgi:hypothetical protein